MTLTEIIKKIQDCYTLEQLSKLGQVMQRDFNELDDKGKKMAQNAYLEHERYLRNGGR